jgi:hypothetical protein
MGGILLKEPSHKPIYISMFKMRGSVTKVPIGGLKHAVALRAIGQDLSGLLIEYLEMTVAENLFVVHIRRVGQADPVVRRYNAKDIVYLDELGATRQTNVSVTPDASSLAESLRTVGRLVDQNRGRLIKLCKDQRKIAFEYQDENGALQKQEHYSLSYYQGQQEGVSQRGTGKREDVWEDSR